MNDEGSSNNINSISFTGTRQGMTEEQKASLKALLRAHKPTIFVHGDCVGADEEAHQVALECGIEKIHKRPADVDSTKRAFTKEGEVIAEAKDPLDRNRDIVNDSDLLIATPSKEFEELRSGTWATIRFAKRQNKHVTIIWPDGGVLGT